MKKVGTIIITTLILSILESSFNYELFGGFLNPCLIIALSFSFLMLSEDRSALLIGLFGGIFTDFMSIGIVGMSAMIFIIFIYLSIFIKKNIFKGNFIQLILVVILTLVYKFFMNINDFRITANLVFGGVITSFCTIVFYYIISKFSNKYLSVEYRIKA